MKLGKGLLADVLLLYWALAVLLPEPFAALGSAQQVLAIVSLVLALALLLPKLF